MLKAIQLCLQLREDGLVTAGVPGTAQRSEEQPFGREDREYVAQANIIATRTCLLWLLRTVRYAFFFVEQPCSTRLYNLPYILHNIKVLRRFIPVSKSFLQLDCQKIDQFCHLSQTSSF